MRAQVVLTTGDRLLLARHVRGSRCYWVLPGGGVEPGETPAEAAVRELLEEAGVTVEIERLLFIDVPREAGNVVIRSPRHTFLARIVDGELFAVVDAKDEEREHGHLAGVAWMPFESEEYDEATRDTLVLVRQSLQAPPTSSMLGRAGEQL